MTEFQAFQKIPRLSRGCIITEKIDGTNAQMFIDFVGERGAGKLALVNNDPNSPLFVRAGSRTRWLTPDNDNFGFAGWVYDHADELALLGPGRHFGEWWGKGIQRGYGLSERRFSLFNVSRWIDTNMSTCPEGYILPLDAAPAPVCCHVVPVLYQGPFSVAAADAQIAHLQCNGSIAAPGFMKPEGVVVFHEASGHLYKKTCEHDGGPKNVHHLRAEGKLPRSPQARPYDPNCSGRRKGLTAPFFGVFKRKTDDI